MHKLSGRYLARYSNCQAFVYLSICILFLTAILTYIDKTPFQRFIGNINPIFVIIVSFFLGIFLLSYLIRKTPFKVFREQSLNDYLFIGGVAAFFGFEVIVADIWFADYSPDINVLFPKSLLFYPAIGYVVEVVFHLIPITLFVFIFSRFKTISTNKIVWISILVVAIIEPIFQIWFLGESSQATTIYTIIHVFTFSFVQLLVFKYYDFITMYYFRLVFYLFWHIIWGYLRLELLFN